MPRRRRKSERQREFEAWERQVTESVEKREAELLLLKEEEDRKQEERRARVEERLERLEIDHAARKLHIAELSRQEALVLPPTDWTAREFLEEDHEPPVPVVQGLHYQGGNTLLVAEFKTGKTTLAMNLAAALADHKPFLDKFDVNFPYGRVAFLNYEMGTNQFREWMRSLDIADPERIVPLNLRGWRLPFWDGDTMIRLSHWLLDNKIKFIIIDPAARAWRGLVEHEGDNVQLAEFFGALDELKRLGGVDDLLITTHTPRDGNGRARGGGEVEAWPDSNWYLSKVPKSGGLRSLRAEGRDVLLEDTALEWDEESRSLTAGVGNIRQVFQQNDIEMVVEVLEAEGEFDSLRRFIAAVKGEKNVGSDRAVTAIEDAVEAGLILCREDGPRKHFRLPEVDDG